MGSAGKKHTLIESIFKTGNYEVGGGNMNIAFPILSIIVVSLIYKYEKFQKAKLFFERIFWIDKFQGEGFLRKSLLFFAKCSMLLYLFMLIMTILIGLFFFEVGLLINASILAIVFPLCYRFTMGFQRFYHNI